MRRDKHFLYFTAALLFKPSMSFTVMDRPLGESTNAKNKQDPLMVASLDSATADPSPTQRISQIAFDIYRGENRQLLPLGDSSYAEDEHQFGSAIIESAHSSTSGIYSKFANEFPVINNMMLASLKAASADLLAQTVIAHSGLDVVDWQRTALFCLFGAFYQGGFQYLYQVNIFSKLFDVERFTSLPWAEKLQDGPGLRSLGVQVVLDLIVMSLIYLPTYYTFKAGVFSGGGLDPMFWVHDGISSYEAHFSRDEIDLLRVWLPADLLCFSVPLIMRLPMRQVISLFYTAYLSYSSFGN